MHRIAEALRERHRRIIGRQLVVGGGLIAVGTPVALVGAAAGIEHDHAAVLIAVGDIEFLRRFVDHHVGGLPSWLVEFEPPGAPGLPICCRNFPSDENFKI
jgi:hypothetical protein